MISFSYQSFSIPFSYMMLNTMLVLALASEWGSNKYVSCLLLGSSLRSIPVDLILISLPFVCLFLIFLFSSYCLVCGKQRIYEYIWNLCLSLVVLSSNVDYCHIGILRLYYHLYYHTFRYDIYIIFIIILWDMLMIYSYFNIRILKCNQYMLYLWLHMGWGQFMRIWPWHENMEVIRVKIYSNLPYLLSRKF